MARVSNFTCNNETRRDSPSVKGARTRAEKQTYRRGGRRGKDRRGRRSAVNDREENEDEGR